MNIPKVTVPIAIRPLTAKQQRFVCALLEGQGKSAAYRIAYGNCAGSHDVSTRACRLAKSQGVQAALARAEKGDFRSITICGIEAEILALKKIAHEPTTPAYVRFRALQAVLEHQQAKQEPQPVKSTKEKEPSTVEEIMRVLQAECGQKPGSAQRNNGLEVPAIENIPDLDLD